MTRAWLHKLLVHFGKVHACSERVCVNFISPRLHVCFPLITLCPKSAGPTCAECGEEGGGPLEAQRGRV